MRTIPELLFASERRYQDRPALAIRRELRTPVWSYRDLADGARAAAFRLTHAGVSAGDRVLILAPNTPELVVSMFGAWMAGAVLVPIDLRTPADILMRLVQQTQPRLLIGSAPPDACADLPAIAPATLAERGGPLATVPAGSQPELAEIVFTSGTTGVPKGVMLSHANILSNVASAIDALPIQVGERLLSLLPLSHMMEQTAGLLAPLAAGATMYYATSRRSTAVLAALQRHRIGLLVCVPEILQLLLAGIERQVEHTGKQKRWAQLLGLADRLPMPLRPVLFAPVHRELGGRLRLVLCGGAPLGADVWRTWERLGVRVIQGYGASECSPIVTSNRLNRRLPGTVGWPVRGVQVRLAGDGEVLVRGPNVMAGYWRDSAATTAAFDDGWYSTGDLGRLGAQGELQLLGRKKDMIVLADGRNVFPADVEDVLRLDPAIRECVVLGRPRPHGGEEVHAVVVPAASAAAAQAAVRRANTRLGPQQQIGGMTVWPGAALPRTPSLKIKRAEVLGTIQRQQQILAAPAVAVDSTGGLAAQVVALVARAAGRSTAEVHMDSDLALDLGLDSLARVELAVLLEDELGRSLPDEEIGAQHTVADLLAALEKGARVTATAHVATWPRAAPARLVRSAVQAAVLFPLLGLVCRPRQITGIESLSGVRGPVLLIANHSSHLDSPTVLATLPPVLRRRTAVAAAADYFFRTRRTAILASLLLGAFPFHREGPISASLAYCGNLVDDGYSVLVFPEGTRSPHGELLPFKSGIGLLARELGVPVVPIHVAGLHAILPRGRRWPRPGAIRISIGPPLRVEPTLSNVAATAVLESAMRRLAALSEHGSFVP
jgi:long-chain acyl-CoA synthetase